MFMDEWRKRSNLLALQDRLLWERVCRTIPLHNKLHSSFAKDTANITEDSANIDNKKAHNTNLPIVLGEQTEISNG
ncbi:Uncharacterised protein [Bartonella quintana]|uniref:Uncharacterized protein n=1 Tax=Bartonella quintana JK 73 TaxID=1402976 RepID=W3TZR8_BARQI|nr:hypothetical protein Q650_00366 [Bartonella quintana JK 73rel]ETS16817.1 hypothetical protein Q649_00375 [Bartonella quintana JK 73]SQF97076.1 Uncharacterised protein [Bartonella quintana]